MINLAYMGFGAALGLVLGYGIDYSISSVDSKEGLIHSISGLVISTLGLIWGGYVAGAALAGGITATLLTKQFPEELTNKLAARISAILLFGALSFLFIGIF